LRVADGICEPEVSVICLTGGRGGWFFKTFHRRRLFLRNYRGHILCVHACGQEKQECRGWQTMSFGGYAHTPILHYVVSQSLKNRKKAVRLKPVSLLAKRALKWIRSLLALASLYHLGTKG
jgi:hypothetical protein